MTACHVVLTRWLSRSSRGGRCMRIGSRSSGTERTLREARGWLEGVAWRGKHISRSEHHPIHQFIKSHESESLPEGGGT